MAASNQTLSESRSSDVLNRNIDDDLDTSFNTQLNRVAPNNETIAPNRNRSVLPLADLESNSSTIGSNRYHQLQIQRFILLDHLINQM